MQKLLFHSGTRNASSWALRAWLALRAAQLDFAEVTVDIRRPQRFINLAAIGQLSPSGTVPMLEVDDVPIFDSIAIMEFANDACGGALLPVDPVRRGQARSLMGWQHAGLSSICARISFESAFYPYKRTLTDAETGEAARLFAYLETIIVEGDVPFLFGAVSLADFALAPAIIRLSRHGLVMEAWPKARAWADALLGYPFLCEWLDEADQLPHIWCDDYLLPGHPVTLTPSEPLPMAMQS